MATIASGASRPFSASSANPVARAVSAALSGFAARRAARRAAGELSSMTDRELADIGISRSDIAGAVSGRLLRRA